jgi:hypothetical protein
LRLSIYRPNISQRRTTCAVAINPKSKLVTAEREHILSRRVVVAKLRDVAALWWPPTAARDARTFQVDGQVVTRVKSCRWRLQRDGHEGRPAATLAAFFELYRPSRHANKALESAGQCPVAERRHNFGNLNGFLNI